MSSNLVRPEHCRVKKLNRVSWLSPHNIDVLPDCIRLRTGARSESCSHRDGYIIRAFNGSIRHPGLGVKNESSCGLPFDCELHFTNSVYGSSSAARCTG